MTILVDHEIRSELQLGRLVVDPIDMSLIQPNSIDVRLGSQFSWHKPYEADPVNGGIVRAYYEALDPICSASLLEGIEHADTDRFVIHPGQFVLGATLERFQLPSDIVGQLTGKSSLARLGLMVHVTAGFIDAGFSSPPATITLELFNVGCRSIVLRSGMAVAQMVFTRTAECEIPYNKKAGAKYNGQHPAAHSKYYLNGASTQQCST